MPRGLAPPPPGGVPSLIGGGDCERLAFGYLEQRAAGVRVDRGPAGGGVEAVDRPVAGHAEADPDRGEMFGLQTRRSGGPRGADPHRVEIERGQAVQAVAGIERRHPGVHHDQRGREPHHEQQVAGDTQPAVEKCEGAPQRGRAYCRNWFGSLAQYCAWQPAQAK